MNRDSRRPGRGGRSPVGPARAETRRRPRRASAACRWEAGAGSPPPLAFRGVVRRRGCCRRDVRGAAWRKGGHLTGLALAAKLGDEITQCAVGQAETAGEVGQRKLVDKEGPQDFIAALQELVGFEKELLAASVVHE